MVKYKKKKKYHSSQIVRQTKRKVEVVEEKEQLILQVLVLVLNTSYLSRDCVHAHLKLFMHVYF